MFNLLPHDYPAFWSRSGLLAQMLRPLSMLYGCAGYLRGRLVRTEKLAIPVVCVGNLSIGGVGKTPIVSALATALRQCSVTVHLVSHGYGGTKTAPHRVELNQDTAAMVGDEALLLAQIAPTWVGKNRAETAKAAVDAGAELIVLDDGWQDPHLHKDYILAVVQAENPFGNGLLLPAGPLRQKPACLAIANRVVAVGENIAGELHAYAPLLARRRMVLLGEEIAEGTRVFAFCGLGRSAQFHQSIAALSALQGWHLAGFRAFPDHQPWHAGILRQIRVEAGEAILLTSAKDHVRLPVDWQKFVRICALELDWAQESAFTELIETLRQLR